LCAAANAAAGSWLYMPGGSASFGSHQRQKLMFSYGQFVVLVAAKMLAKVSIFSAIIA
jgi:hypothetical protein